jgi:hypothetical protein
MPIFGTTNKKMKVYNGTTWKEVPYSHDLTAYTETLCYPSSTLQLSDDTEETDSSGDGAYTLLKTLTALASGKIKTMFDLQKDTATGEFSATTIAGIIYVNNSAEGTEHVTDNQIGPGPSYDDNFETFTDASIDVNDGDSIQLYTKSIDSPAARAAQNFRVYYDLSTKGYVDTVEDSAHWEYISAASATNITSTGSISSVPANCNFILCQVDNNSSENGNNKYQEITLAREGKTTGNATVYVGGGAESLSLTFDVANSQVDYAETGTTTWNLYVWYYT